MLDLNRMLGEIQEKTSKIKDDVIILFKDYDRLYHEVNGIYMAEKLSSGAEGLDDFFRLLQVIRRNRDVAGSLTRGFDSIQPTERFKFIEEEEIARQEKKARKPRTKKSDSQQLEHHQKRLEQAKVLENSTEQPEQVTNG